MIHVVIHMKIGEQQDVNALLKTEIGKMEAQIKEIEDIKKKRESLVARMNVIQSLQRNRPLTVRIFDEITRALPDGIYLSELERKNNTVSLTGKAESNSQISILMRKIDASEWLTKPRLTEIKWNEESTNPDPSANDFRLEFEVKSDSLLGEG